MADSFLPPGKAELPTSSTEEGFGPENAGGLTGEDRGVVYRPGDGLPSVVVHSLADEEERLWETDPEVEKLLQGLPEIPEDADLARLRELLFKREISLLDRLQTYLFGTRHNARMVSRVLAEAVALRAPEDKKLRTAMEPMVDDIMQRAMRRHQRDFVNVLFPLMGPAIRKSIAETFRSMLGNFSKSLEMAFSWKGLRWRIEGWRSGKPFSEIVLLHTLVYRVEQIFFIHSETGLVLSHQVNDGVGSQDADMVSAMLTAIQDFVRDAFSADSSGELESLSLGDFTIFIEKSPQAYLACVVRGIPPRDFHEQLSMTLELLLTEYAEQLTAFDGDSAPFQGADRLLDNCMVERYADDAHRVPLWAKAVPVLLVLALFGGGGLFHYQGRLRAAEARALLEQEIAEKERVLTSLRQEPGLLLIDVDDGTVPCEAMLMKDALADSPEDVLVKIGADGTHFRFKVIPFISYDPVVIEKRVLSELQLPGSVTMEFTDDGTLKFYGLASMLWTVQTRDRVRSLPGVKNVDMSGLHDPMLDRLATLKRQVDATSVEFPLGKSVPVDTEYAKLAVAVDTLVEMEKLVQDMGFGLTLTVYGHADTTGTDTRNYEVSRDRTQTVAAMLYARGSGIPISTYGMGSQYPKGRDTEREREANTGDSSRGDQASRRIELRVHVVRTATPDIELFR